MANVSSFPRAQRGWLWILLALLCCASSEKSHAAVPTAKAAVLARMDEQFPQFQTISRRVWELAELSYEEFQSAQLLQRELEMAGFHVRTNLAGLPTAFVASWGKGRPVIALLGEYDALPELFQDAVPERSPRVSPRPGHGCGHNLLGTGAAFAAIAVKQEMERNHLPGTIRFFGCPAEEKGAGKVFMIRGGAFADCDAALTWHPDSVNEPGKRGTLANVGARFRFHGVAAHAARAPEKGRSALDAALLMAHAVDLLREHVPQETRIHYIFTKAGTASNVVPEISEVQLVIRHPDAATLDGLWTRIMKCAEAGALATETRLEVEILGALANVVPNDALAALFENNMRHAGGVRYSPEELAFARRLRASLPQDALPPLESAFEIKPLQNEVTFWSTDVGDVSWNVPTGEIRAATFVPGVSVHTWQSTACAGMSIGQKGMLVAAKTLALTALDLLQDPRQVQAAHENFEQRLAGRKYISRIPADAKPALP